MFDDEAKKKGTTKYDHGVAGHTWSTYDASSMDVYYYLSPRDWPKYAIQPEVSASLRIVAAFSDKGSGAISTKSGWLLLFYSLVGPAQRTLRSEREKVAACHRVSMRAPTTH